MKLNCLTLSNYEYNSVLFSFDFRDKYNILYDYSGVGKSFMLDCISAYLTLENIPYALFNYKCRQIYALDVDVILIDNADIILNRESFNRIKDSDCLFIISTKFPSSYNMYEGYGLYTINNENGEKISAIKRR